MLRLSISRVGVFSATTKASSALSKRACSSAGVPIDKALRSDVKMLGKSLGEVIKAEREDVFLAVEKLRKLGREVRNIMYAFYF